MTIIAIRPRTLLRWRLRLACYTTGDRMAAHRKFNGTLDFSGTGSTFVGLSVKRFPQIHDNVGANTRLSIAGLGTLWLHRVIHRSQAHKQVGWRWLHRLIRPYRVHVEIGRVKRIRGGTPPLRPRCRQSYSLPDDRN